VRVKDDPHRLAESFKLRTVTGAALAKPGERGTGTRERIARPGRHTTEEAGTAGPRPA